ncbi:MAG: aspartate kinase [Myxococcales bacterium]|nr:aspartate kinase [Myxococcota bacterium]MDW8283324.1 aspartate kinase [Myxococcales bacterium]
MATTAKTIVVQKYGGSSVANLDRLRSVAERVAATARQGRRVVVVVSAMGKTTDELLALARSISPAPPRRELDMLLSCGERISMALLAMALGELGVDAISFTGSQSGILTNDRHSGARIIEVRPVRIQDELERDRVVIVAGFQGMSYKREITTLGRGGSDTTAVALAAALGAEACEIYSDVDGVYSADPKVVPDAHHLPELSYDEMQELAEHGAKVLNAQAVSWARRAGIVIHARQTAGSSRETRIVPGGEADPIRAEGLRARAVTATRTVVQLRTARRGLQALSLLGEEGVALRHSRLVGTGEAASLEATLVRDDLPDWPHTLARLRDLGTDLVCDEEHGTVTAVGAGLGSNARVLAQVGAHLVACGLHPVRMEASSLSLCTWLPHPEVEEATRALHSLLCHE